MSKRILITGAMGYLGSRLRPYLKEHGFSCVGFDTGFFADGLLTTSDDTDVILGDMRDFPVELLDGIDVVIHLAAVSNDPFGNLDVARIYDPTRRYTFDLAALCKARGIKFIFPSSCSVYGAGQGEALLNEQGSLSPQTPYSVNKVQIEEDLAAMSDKNFSPIALRLATAFGMSPRIRFDLVINMLTAMAYVNKKIVLNSDGKAWRPNVHIDDICEAFKRSIEVEYTEPKLLIVNIGDTLQNFQIIDMAQMIQAQVKGCELVFLNHMHKGASTEEFDLVKDRKIQDGVDKRTYKVCFEFAQKIFPGFQCQWDVTRGVGDMLRIFHDVNLNENIFKSFKFYRLQKIEYLHRQCLINDDLRWLTKRECEV